MTAAFMFLQNILFNFSLQAQIKNCKKGFFIIFFAIFLTIFSHFDKLIFFSKNLKLFDPIFKKLISLTLFEFYNNF